MVLIIKKLVPIYKKSDNIPKQYLNLRKPQHVTTFKYIYPNMQQILEKEYGIKKNDKIIVYWTKEISLPHFNRYRMNFRKVYSGRMDGLYTALEVIQKQKRNV